MERAGVGLCTYEREGRERGRPFALLLCSQIMRIDGLVVRVLDCVAPLFTKTVAPRARTHTHPREVVERGQEGREKKRKQNTTKPISLRPNGDVNVLVAYQHRHPPPGSEERPTGADVGEIRDL